MKARLTSDKWLTWECPGCTMDHGVPVEGPRKWSWNGSLERPTLAPSVLVNKGGANPAVPVCHANMTDGKLFFHDDCSHGLRGNVEMVEIEA